MCTYPTRSSIPPGDSPSSLPSVRCLPTQRLPLLLRAAGRPAVQQKVYHAGHDEADEIAEVRVTKPDCKWSVGFQAEHLELLRDEEQRHRQPDQPGDETVPVDRDGLAESHRLAVAEDVKVEEHDGEPGHDPVIEHDQEVLEVLQEVLIADQREDEAECTPDDGQVPPMEADVEYFRGHRVRVEVEHVRGGCPEDDGEHGEHAEASHRGF